VTLKSLALAGLMTALFVTAMPAHALTIDSFNCTNQLVNEGTASTTNAAACAIGGTREVTLLDVTGTSGTQHAEGGVDAAGGVLFHSNDGPVNSKLLVGWQTPLVDVTEAGLNQGFEIMVKWVDIASSIGMIVGDHLGNYSYGLIHINAFAAPALYTIPFSSFFGGADLTKVTWMSMLLSSSGNGLDMGIDYVNASNPVPEPATFMLVGLGLLGVGARRAFRKA
jgi:PEP-CTERM motif